MAPAARLRRLERRFATPAERRFRAVSERLDAIAAADRGLVDRAEAVRVRAAEEREGRVAYGWRGAGAALARHVDAADAVLGVGLALLSLGMIFVWWPLALITPGAVLLYIALWHRRPAAPAETEAD